MSPQLPSIIIQPEVNARTVGEDRWRRTKRTNSTTTNTPIDRHNMYCHTSVSEALRAVTAPKLQMIPAVNTMAEASEGCDFLEA